MSKVEGPLYAFVKQVPSRVLIGFDRAGPGFPVQVFRIIANDLHAIIAGCAK